MSTNSLLIAVIALNSFMLQAASAQQLRKNPFPLPPSGEIPADEDFPESRTWTDANYFFSTRAKLLGVSGGKAKLQRSDRSQFTVNLSSLSVEDRDWIKKHTTKSGKPIPAVDDGPSPAKPVRKADEETKTRLLGAVSKGVRAAAEAGLSGEMKLRVMAQAQYFQRELEKGNDPRLSTDELFRMDGDSVRVLRAYFPEFMGPE
jgi:hypothetical protein